MRASLKTADAVPEQAGGTGAPVKLCIIGAGISGLSAAYYLTRYPDVETTVYERSDTPGGRANVEAGAEHCPRVFLSDYTHLFGILRSIDSGSGASIYDTLQPVHRYCYLSRRGWTEISHLYVPLARELSLAERFRVVRARRTPPLVAANVPGTNENRYGSIRNFSPLTAARTIANMRRSTIAFALAGPTDEMLISPWIRHLKRADVTFRTSTPVETITPLRYGVSVRTAAGASTFDAVIVTAFVPDLAAILAASGLDHSIKATSHTHCKCMTLSLSPGEKILASRELALYSRDGINIVVQPDRCRCVVLCTRPLSTDVSYVVSRVREFLGLEHPVLDIRVRDNQRPEEAIYAADYVQPDAILRRGYEHVYFAGSFIRNSYPIDSGEGAARSAFAAVGRLARDYHLAADHDALASHSAPESLARPAVPDRRRQELA